MDTVSRPGRMSETYEPSMDRAEHDDRLGADAGEQLGRDARSDDEATRQRQVGDTRLDRRVAEHGLHVEREEEEHRQEAGDRHQLGGVGGGDALDLQDRERDERVAHAQLVEQEPGEKHRGAGEPGDRAPRAPADVRCLHERVDE
jgi:hypothetical protein